MKNLKRINKAVSSLINKLNNLRIKQRDYYRTFPEL